MRCRIIRGRYEIRAVAIFCRSRTRPQVRRADNPGMMLRRLPRRVAPLALVLALWTALPSVEWCPFSWADFVAGATTESTTCESGAACDPVCARMMSGTNSGGACATQKTATCPLPCDPSPDPLPFGDRAWCVHPPVDALVVSTLHIDPPAALPALATLVPPLVVPPPAASAPRAITTVFQSPVLLAPHAPPLGRAPPSCELAPRC